MWIICKHAFASHNHLYMYGFLYIINLLGSLPGALHFQQSINLLANGHCQILVYLLQIELLVPLTRYFTWKCCKMSKKQWNVILQKCHHRLIFPMGLAGLHKMQSLQTNIIIVFLKWLMAHKSRRLYKSLEMDVLNAENIWVFEYIGSIWVFPK